MNANAVIATMIGHVKLILVLQLERLFQFARIFSISNTVRQAKIKLHKQVRDLIVIDCKRFTKLRRHSQSSMTICFYQMKYPIFH